MTHICVSKPTTTGSDNGLSPGRRQAIIWTNAGILLIGPLGTNLSEILSEIHTFSLKEMHLKMSSGEWRPFILASMCWIIIADTPPPPPPPPPPQYLTLMDETSFVTSGVLCNIQLTYLAFISELWGIPHDGTIWCMLRLCYFGPCYYTFLSIIDQFEADRFPNLFQSAVHAKYSSVCGHNNSGFVIICGLQFSKTWSKALVKIQIKSRIQYKTLCIVNF